MKKIGIYSGSFDPVHDGHIAFAKEAMALAGLDKVFFLVEPRPRRKQGVKAFEHRIAMMQLAIAKDKELGLIVLEQTRFDVMETWPQIQARFKGAELFMLMGEDVFGRLSSWPRVDTLISSASFIVGLRKQSANDAAEHLQVIEETRGLRLTYTVFKPSEHRHSSRKIRSALRKGHLPDGIDTDVAAYIRAQKLYSSIME